MEKRLFPRIATVFPVEVKFKDLSGKDIDIKGEAVNLSEGGVCIALDRAITSESIENIQLDLSPKFSLFEAKAQIIWNSSLAKENKFCYGLRLLDLEEEANSILKRVLLDAKKKMKQSIVADKAFKGETHPLYLFEKTIRYSKRVNEVKVQGLYFYMREIDSASQSKVIRKGREMIMLASNNYLGLTTHPKVKEAAIKAIEKYGTGSGGVRMLSGSMDLHEKLEHKLATFKETEACIVYTSGYGTNIGIIPTLLKKRDVVVIDEKSHASIVDSCRLSDGRVRVFKHNNMESLERILASYSKDTPKLIVTDGVFSMDGDIADLPGIYDLAKRYNAITMVDEAHATGVLGKHGRGTLEHFGLEGKIDIVMGTLSKALGGIGGFVCSNEIIVSALKHFGRPFVFSTSLPPSICASLIAAIEVIEEEPELLTNLWSNIRHMKEGLQKLGYNTGNTESALIPIIIGNEVKMYQMAGLLEELEVLVSPVARPAVRRGGTRLRVSIMATHNPSDLDRALEAFKKAGKRLGLI